MEQNPVLRRFSDPGSPSAQSRPSYNVAQMAPDSSTGPFCRTGNDPVGSPGCRERHLPGFQRKNVMLTHKTDLSRNQVPRQMRRRIRCARSEPTYQKIQAHPTDVLSAERSRRCFRYVQITGSVGGIKLDPTGRRRVCRCGLLHGEKIDKRLVSGISRLSWAISIRAQ